jgi:hypothetical protein
MVFFDEQSNAVQYDAIGSFCPGKNLRTGRIPLTGAVGTACRAGKGRIIVMTGTWVTA